MCQILRQRSKVSRCFHPLISDGNKNENKNKDKNNQKGRDSSVKRVTSHIKRGSGTEALPSMDRNSILQALALTLDPNQQLRETAEAQLTALEKQVGFTAFCLDLAVDPTVPMGQRSSAAVLFKNRIATFWQSKSGRAITEPEQQLIKQKLIESLLRAYNDNHVKPQLTTAVKLILNKGSWPLNEAIISLLSSTADQSHVYTGLLLLLEVTRSMRYDFTEENRRPLNVYVDQTFPKLEELAFELLKYDDYKSGEMLYFILKIFKFATMLNLPNYLRDQQHLNSWISIHLMIVQKPTPQAVLDVEPSDRVLDKRVKCTKWGFANLQRFYQRYATPKSQYTDAQFMENFSANYVPEILKVFFGIIEKWGTGSWVSDPSLYNLISFLEKCIIYDSWNLIQPHFDAILRHLLFPCLCQKDLELFEDDQEEYVRRFFDINREAATADVAAVDALFVTAHHRFEEMNKVLALLNEIFNNFNQNQSLDNALKAEGGLRILSSISFCLYKEGSPLQPQVDQIIDGFVVPLLSVEHEFLRARACETISIFSYTYTDKNVLSRVFQGVYENFKNDTCIPIQIEAADALKVLITDPLVTDVIRPEVPRIVQKLMALSKEFEMDMLSEIMETFVEVFSEELQPFAREMGQSLCHQFIQVATEMIELTNSGCDVQSAEDKEFQGVGILNTMATMAYTMTKVDLEPVFYPAVEFVVQNAAIAFLSETMELLDTLVFHKKAISPGTWSIYNLIVESFGTYAAEFFDSYASFFESVIVYGFGGLNSQSPRVVALQTVLHELTASGLEFEETNTFELIETMTIVLKEVNPEFPLALQHFHSDEEMTPLSIVKIVLASLYANAELSLQIMEQSNGTVRLLELWYNISSTLETVYGLRLQIAALISLLSVPKLPSTLLGFVTQLAQKLSTTVIRLPEALAKANGNGPALEGEEFDFDDENEGFKDTAMDGINLFQHFQACFGPLEQFDNARYKQIVGVFTQDLEQFNSALRFADAPR